jgi:hypothetical protein
LLFKAFVPVNPLHSDDLIRPLTAYRLLATGYRLSYSQIIMGRPPQLPSVLLARQAYQWINRVNQKFNALSAVNLSPEKRRELNQWLELEFIDGALSFADAGVSRQQIVEAVCARSPGANLPSGRAGESPGKTSEAPSKQAIIDLWTALRMVEDLAQSAGPKATLSLNLLLQLNRSLGNGEFRKTLSQTSSITAEHLPLILGNACTWFTMESFAELNPVEQAAIALLRLVELAPFEQANEPTALLGASLFTLRSQLPPIIFRREQREAFTAAVQEGLRMNTQAMVELVAKAIEQTLDGMEKFIAQDR